MPLPDVIVIGGMKCGTTSLHGYLAEHPQVTMSTPKELNFFFGDGPGGPGNWWRGSEWYVRRFADGPGIRGEASPGYTSPAHPEVAARIAAVVPDVRLVYVARDPLERAVSQYQHHRRDGDEPRDLGTALLDPGSQYVTRSRHAERLRPFLDRFPTAQIRVLEHRDLLVQRRATLGALFAWLGLPDHWTEEYTREHNASTVAHPQAPDEVTQRFRAAVADDAERFQELLVSDLALRPVRA